MYWAISARKQHDNGTICYDAQDTVRRYSSQLLRSANNQNDMMSPEYNAISTVVVARTEAYYINEGGIAENLMFRHGTCGEYTEKRAIRYRSASP